MEGFLHIYHKSSNLKLPKEKIMNVIDDYKSTKHSYNIKMNDRITGIYYTNESELYRYKDFTNHLFCPVGQFIDNKINLQLSLYHGTEEMNINTVANLAGAFSISTVDFQQNIINIFTHTVRAESVFIYEDAAKVIVGSDPLLISVFSSDSLKPLFNPANFVSYFEQGYFADELTPYQNVKCLPPNSQIKIEPTIQIIPIDDTYQSAFSFDKSNDLLTEISNKFIDAFNIVQDKSTPILSGLTGGKDSRVILLALMKNGFNVKTHTTGFNDHPDVIVAKKLAEILGVPHKVNERKLNNQNQLPVDLESRLINTTKASSGLMSAYDNVTTSTKFNNKNNFNGVAASLITGGFNKFNHSVDDSLSNSLKKAVYKFSDFYIDKNNKYNNFLEDFAQKSNDYQTLLHMFFLLYRTGRWTSDSRVPKSYATNSFSVFLDNQLTKSAMKLNMTDLRNELIHYKLIEQLNPEILNIPFANQRFAFEKNGPVSPEDYDNWLQREPVYSKNKIGSYNWRNLANRDNVLVNAFKEVILSRKNNIVFDIVDYNKIENLLNSKIEARTNKFIWSLASMIKFTDHMKGTDQSGKMKLKIEIPEDNLIQMRVPSKIIDLTGEYDTINDALEYDPVSKRIRLTHKQGNLYLKTFDGGFNQIPKRIDISKVKSIDFNSNLKNLDKYHNIKMYIMFYTKDKRFKTIILDPQITENKEIVFHQKITVPRSSKFFRTAFHFKEKKNAKLDLNYSYAKLIY